MRTTTFLTLIAATLALPALALDLQEARREGLVGEMKTGYIMPLKPSSEVNALVADVNTKRKEEYKRISKENGQPVDVVAKLAVPQIVENLPSGAMYQTDAGWKKR